MKPPIHPFHRLTPAAQKQALLLSVLLVLLINIALRALDGPLRTAAAPAGIISFEFAGDVTTAAAILDSWGETGRLYAALGLGLDFLYPLLYAAAIGLGCLRAAATWPAGSAAARLGLGLTWGISLAALLDYGENYALIQLLLGARDAYWPALAYWLAAVKFGFVIAGLVYVMGGGGRYGWRFVGRKDSK